MSTRAWSRTYISLRHITPAPKTELTTVFATMTAGQTTLREILDISFYVQFDNPNTGYDPYYWTEVQIGVGIWVGFGVTAPTTAPSPLTTPNSTGWLFTTMMYPRVDVYDVASPANVVEWRPRPGTIFTKTQRKCPTGQNGNVFIVWDTSDPSGLINAAGANNTYQLSAQVHARVLIQSP